MKTPSINDEPLSLTSKYTIRWAMITLCMISMGSSMFFLDLVNIAVVWKVNPGMIIFFFTMLILSQLYLMVNLLFGVNMKCQSIIAYVVEFGGFVIGALYLVFGLQLMIQSVKQKALGQMYNYALAWSDVIAGTCVVIANGLCWLYKQMK